MAEDTAARKWRVLVTPRSLDLAAQGLDQVLARAGCDIVRVVGPLKGAALAEAWRDVDAAILGLDEANAEAIHEARRLRIISRYGTGYDQVDVAAATSRGIAVTITPGANQVSVAELTIGLLIALARNFGQALRSEPTFSSPEPGTELAGKVLGIVGLGRVGREVAARARAFDMRILYTDPRPPGALGETELGVRRISLHRLLPRADALSLHCPLTKETHGLIGRRELAQMKPSAVLVNTARGKLVDETALAEALTSGRLAAAAVDVREIERNRSDDPLRGVPNVLFTPHVGGRTSEAMSRMGRLAVENVVAIRRGERPAVGLVNPEVFDGAASG